MKNKWNLDNNMDVYCGFIGIVECWAVIVTKIILRSVGPFIPYTAITQQAWHEIIWYSGLCITTVPCLDLCFDSTLVCRNFRVVKGDLNMNPTLQA